MKYYELALGEMKEVRPLTMSMGNGPNITKIYVKYEDYEELMRRYKNM